MKKVVLIAAVLLLLVGCKSTEETANLNWFPSKEDAIKEGLKQEGAASTAVLDTIEENGDTFVLYELNNALGVANIPKGSKGFGWYRSSAYINFQTDSNGTPFMYGGYDIQTYSGMKLSVIAGKVYDNSIKKLLLRDNGKEKELQINEKSGLFFSVSDSDFHSLEVVAVTATRDG